MKKRILSLLLAALLLLSLLPAASLPARAGSEIIARGTWGSTLEWSLNNEGRLSINGNGQEMPEGTWNEDTGQHEMPWYPYRSRITAAELYNITSVCEDAFRRYPALRSVTFPDGLRSIGNYAFYDCWYLSSAVFPEGLQSIGNYAFYDCFDLRSTVFPEGLQSIGDSAFCYSYLGSVVLPEGLQTIGDYAFRASGLTSVVLPESLQSFGDFAFYNCEELKSVVLPEGLQSIGDSAFCGCSRLRSVNLPEGITALHGVFRNSGLTSFSIPASLTEIDGHTFEGCSNLASFTVHPDNPVYWVGEDGILYASVDGEKVLVRCPPALEGLGNYAISPTVNRLEICAFDTCRKLDTVTVPENITELPEGTFRSCTRLASAVFSEGLQSIGDHAFDNCYSLSSLTCPEGLNSIGNYAFYDCENLSSVLLREGLNSIGNYVFYDCKNLSSVLLPEGLTSIGNYAFAYCENLSSVALPAGLQSLGDHAFFCCHTLPSVVLPEGLTSIENYAFYDCNHLRSVVFPEGLQSIGENAFSCCFNLHSVVLPEGLQSIGAYAFARCYDPNTAPHDLFSFAEKQATQSYTPLSSVTFPDSLQSIGTGAFFYCNRLSSAALPEGLQSIGDEAFKFCENLKSVVLPAGLTGIGYCTFWNCPLEDLYFGGTGEAWAALDPTNASVNAQRIHLDATAPESHWTGQVSKAPACTTVGYQDMSCPCGFAQTHVTMPALGHDFVEGVCTRCGKTDYEAEGAELPFGDVPETAYYAEAVAWAVNNGVAAGTSEDSFSPDENCSRAQLMTFLWRAEGCPEPVSQDCPFTDVPADAYYTKAVLWAVEQGITSGTSDTTFSPKQVCTRAQTVTFLWRAEGSPAPASGGLPFTDLVSGAYYYKAVKWAAQQGIVSGVSETSFAPNQACTRGQAVTLLYRYYHIAE